MDSPMFTDSTWVNQQLAQILVEEMASGNDWPLEVSLDVVLRWAGRIARSVPGGDAMAAAIEIGDLRPSYVFLDAIQRAIAELMEIRIVEIAPTDGFPVARLTKEAFIGDIAEVSAAGIPMQLRIDELSRMPYVDYLQTPEWRDRRGEHIRSAGGRCQLCNSNEVPLHVHHRTYANRGRERFYDLVVLCPFCHELFHKSGRKIR